MSNVDDHGLEVIKKAAEYTEPLSPSPKKDYYIKVGGAPIGAPYDIPPIPVVFANPETPTIYNIASPGSEIEFTQLLTGNIQKITIQARGNSRIKFSFATQGDYITIPPGASYSEDSVKLVDQTLYLKTSLGTETVEVLTWS